MDVPLAYRNGRFLPASELTVSPTDTGFVLGATVAEQLRTFSGKLFRLDDHLARLARSLEIVGVRPKQTRGDLATAAEQLAARNHALVDPADDLGLTIFVTPGVYPAYAASDEPAEPNVSMHTYRLPFRLWAGKYQRGQVLRTTAIEQVPASSWPATLKCRSRMHYYLADRQAALAEPGARALLLDSEGRVTETSTANVVAYRADRGLVAPPESQSLEGISLQQLWQLAAELDIPAQRRELSVGEVAAADEVLLTSTPLCLLPVVRLNGRPIGRGTPGQIFRRLLKAWSERVGLDVAEQARRFAGRGSAAAKRGREPSRASSARNAFPQQR